jgi:hypothetical protein
LWIYTGLSTLLPHGKEYGHLIANYPKIDVYDLVLIEAYLWGVCEYELEDCCDGYREGF